MTFGLGHVWNLKNTLSIFLYIHVYLNCLFSFSLNITYLQWRNDKIRMFSVGKLRRTYLYGTIIFMIMLFTYGTCSRRTVKLVSLRVPTRTVHDNCRRPNASRYDEVRTEICPYTCTDESGERWILTPNRWSKVFYFRLSTDDRHTYFNGFLLTGVKFFSN